MSVHPKLENYYLNIVYHYIKSNKTKSVLKQSKPLFVLIEAKKKENKCIKKKVDWETKNILFYVYRHFNDINNFYELKDFDINNYSIIKKIYKNIYKSKTKINDIKFINQSYRQIRIYVNNKRTPNIISI